MLRFIATTSSLLQLQAKFIMAPSCLLGVVVKNWLLQWTVTYVKRHNILNALCKFPGELSKVEKDNWLKDAEDSV